MFAFGEDLRVIPASDETKARAAAAVLEAASAQGAEPLERMFAAPVLCGPRLWQRLKGAMPDDKARVGTAMLIFDTASGRESWGIQPLDLRTISEDARKAIQAIVESQPGKMPVESGVFRGDGVKLLAAALRERYLRGKLSVAQASKADLDYYWLMIPYDIEEPVVRLDTANGSLLLDVAEDGRISWIDLLPE